MMKKVLLIILAAALSACSAADKKAGLAVYNEEDPYIHTFSRQIQGQTGESFTITSYDARNSQMLQNEQIEEMVENKLDLMIINPVDRLGVYPIIRNLKEKEIPVIFFNREPLLEDLNLWKKAYYVGARAEQSGQLQADLLIELFGGDPERLNSFDKNGDNRIQAVILKGEQGHQDAELRTSEVVKTFEERGFELEILITEAANWNRNEAYVKMESILKTFGDDMETILSNNDAMALGAITRLREEEWFLDSNKNGRIDPLDKGWIPIVGIDGIDDAVLSIEAGYLYGTVLNDSEEQALAIVELSEYLLGKRNLKEFTFPIVDDKYIWIDYKVFLSE